MPAKEVMADHLTEAAIDDSDKAECIDTFILNMKFLGLLRTIAGSERIVSIEQELEELRQHIRQRLHRMDLPSQPVVS